MISLLFFPKEKKIFQKLLKNRNFISMKERKSFFSSFLPFFLFFIKILKPVFLQKDQKSKIISPGKKKMVNKITKKYHPLGAQEIKSSGARIQRFLVQRYRSDGRRRATYTLIIKRKLILFFT